MSRCFWSELSHWKGLMHPSFGQRNNFWGTESSDALLESSASLSVVSCSSTSGVAFSICLGLIGTKFAPELLMLVLDTRDGTLGTSNFLQGMNLLGKFLMVLHSPQTFLGILNVADKAHPSHSMGLLTEDDRALQSFTFTLETPPCVRVAVSVSCPEFRWTAMWDLIAATFLSQDPFPPCGSEKSILDRQWSITTPLAQLGLMHSDNKQRCLVLDKLTVPLVWHSLIDQRCSKVCQEQWSYAGYYSQTRKQRSSFLHLLFSLPPQFAMGFLVYCTSQPDFLEIFLVDIS